MIMNLERENSEHSTRITLHLGTVLDNRHQPWEPRKSKSSTKTLEESQKPRMAAGHGIEEVIEGTLREAFLSSN